MRFALNLATFNTLAHVCALVTLLLRSDAEPGVTWWQEGYLPNDTLDDGRHRIHQRPPPLESMMPSRRISPLR